MLRPEETRVLIVEDESLVSEMIYGVVEDIGYKVAGRACSGQEALEMTLHLRPDVILMDIKMPQMDGLEATRRISESFPTPIILLTAYESPDLIQQASAAGASAYLVKPPDPQAIARTIPLSISRFAETVTLRLLNQELHNKNQDLDAFAHMVAHELQGPLTLIKGYAQLLKMRARLPEEMEEQLNTIARNSHKMGTIIKELFLLASINQDNLPLKPLNMGRIVAEAQQRLSHLIEESQAQIAYPSAWPVALGHAPWIEEVWINYLSNALKYGGHPPHIQLGATATSDGYIRFWVRDNGPGLTEVDKTRLFLPFTQFSQLHIQGEGLGLSIVRRIIEKLGGKVGVESEAIPGKGSLFYFTLPSDTSL